MLPVDVASNANDILTVNDRDQLERAFRRLTVEQRAVMVLHHYIGLPVPEVADRLGIPLGTAKSRIHHATTALRASIEADARVPSQERSA
jgi:RNA polymerase sigma-70 factor (ECF subfamily)